ncbi:hypothetical protein [Flavobacterium sp. JP2137]|uniref:hypothetical protein n=1 Tax=Flavobacterium sp. JP2137 TaxID=3414510 RepID=UPI003D2FA312
MKNKTNITKIPVIVPILPGEDWCKLKENKGNKKKPANFFAGFLFHSKFTSSINSIWKRVGIKTIQTRAKCHFKIDQQNNKTK